MSTVGSLILNLPQVTSPTPQLYIYAEDNISIRMDHESLTLAVLLEGWEYSGRRLNSILLVQLRTSRDGVLATTYLEAEEYGWGNTEGEAIMDLMTSLVEYMESLEARQDQLAQSIGEELQRLRQLFRPASS